MDQTAQETASGQSPAQSSPLETPQVSTPTLEQAQMPGALQIQTPGEPIFKTDTGQTVGENAANMYVKTAVETRTTENEESTMDTDPRFNPPMAELVGYKQPEPAVSQAAEPTLGAVTSETPNTTVSESSPTLATTETDSNPTEAAGFSPTITESFHDGASADGSLVTGITETKNEDPTGLVRTEPETPEAAPASVPEEDVDKQIDTLKETLTQVQEEAKKDPQKRRFLMRLAPLIGALGLLFSRDSGGADMPSYVPEPIGRPDIAQPLEAAAPQPSFVPEAQGAQTMEAPGPVAQSTTEQQDTVETSVKVIAQPGDSISKLLNDQQPGRYGQSYENQEALYQDIAKVVELNKDSFLTTPDEAQKNYYQDFYAGLDAKKQQFGRDLQPQELQEYFKEKGGEQQFFLIKPGQEITLPATGAVTLESQTPSTSSSPSAQ